MIQHHFDLDATYDEYKGKGYQIQLGETCNPENDVQLMTSAVSQTASESDTGAVERVLDGLEKNKRNLMN